MLLSHSATSPHPVCPQAPETESNSRLKLSSINVQKKEKQEQNKVRSEAALAMTVWIQQQIVPSVLLGPASSLQKRQTERERERETGRQRETVSTLGHNNAALGGSVSGARAARQRLQMAAASLYPLAIRPGDPANASPEAPAATDAAAQRGCGAPGPRGPMPAAGAAAARPLSAGVSNHRPGSSLHHRRWVSPPRAARRGCCTEPAAAAGDAPLGRGVLSSLATPRLGRLAGGSGQLRPSARRPRMHAVPHKPLLPAAQPAPCLRAAAATPARGAAATLRANPLSPDRWTELSPARQTDACAEPLPSCGAAAHHPA